MIIGGQIRIKKREKSEIKRQKTVSGITIVKD